MTVLATIASTAVRLKNIFTPDADRRAIQERRKHREQLVQERTRLAQLRPQIEAEVSAGTKTIAALENLDRQFHFVASQISQIDHRDRNTLINGCPSESLQDERRELLRRQKHQLQNSEALTRQVAAAKEIIFFTEKRLTEIQAGLAGRRNDPDWGAAASKRETEAIQQDLAAVERRLARQQKELSALNADLAASRDQEAAIFAQLSQVKEAMLVA